MLALFLANLGSSDLFIWGKPNCTVNFQWLLTCLRTHPLKAANAMNLYDINSSNIYYYFLAPKGTDKTVNSTNQ